MRFCKLWYLFSCFHTSVGSNDSSSRVNCWPVFAILRSTHGQRLRKSGQATTSVVGWFYDMYSPSPKLHRLVSEATGIYSSTSRVPSCSDRTIFAQQLVVRLLVVETSFVCGGAQACTRLSSQYGRGDAERGVWCAGSEKNAEELERLFAPGGPVARE